ncbi:hypothetical protein [Candidatus Phaeomarinobacter ectocarpi]|uniref:hypothetical protein n=1 Tax=Candidatus Phaeomarinibacter ectocarpi TaxID=1458461 RepID=UPI0005C4B9E0|nr:hypothetical protein [Candidatus Phaeomarinobacter ectocarpi]
MLSKTVITLNAAVFILVVPYLEIGPTHVFNPDWPAHARLHEVWQLITNASLSMLAVGLAWQNRFGIAPEVISLAISGSFVAAYLTKALYGGSMAHSDGSELQLMGVNAAFGLLLILSAALIFLIIQRGVRNRGRALSA